MRGGFAVGFVAAGSKCEAEVDVFLDIEGLAAEDEITTNEAG